MSDNIHRGTLHIETRRDEFGNERVVRVSLEGSDVIAISKELLIDNDPNILLPNGDGSYKIGEYTLRPIFPFDIEATLIGSILFRASLE